MKSSSRQRSAADSYAAVHPRRGSLARDRPSRQRPLRGGTSGSRVKRWAQAFVRPGSRRRVSPRSRSHGYARPPGICDRTSDFSEPHRRAGHSEPYRPEPVPNACRPVLSVHGHWPWAADGPACPTALHRAGQTGLCGVVRRCFWGRRTSDEPRREPTTEPSSARPSGRWAPRFSACRLTRTGAPSITLFHGPRSTRTSWPSPAQSGGGNQTLYAGATDQRLAAVVPVCGVGTYDSYLTTACCVCEVNAGGATYATTGDLLASVLAPRALSS